MELSNTIDHLILFLRFIFMHYLFKFGILRIFLATLALLALISILI